jgi:hypothetical protein
MLQHRWLIFNDFQDLVDHYGSVWFGDTVGWDGPNPVFRNGMVPIIRLVKRMGQFLFSDW